MSASNDEKIGCGAWIVLGGLLIFFLGQLGSSITMGGR